jgi:hypothetical protein
MHFNADSHESIRVAELPVRGFLFRLALNTCGFMHTARILVD